MRSVTLTLTMIALAVGLGASAGVGDNGNAADHENDAAPPPFKLHEPSELQLKGSATIGSWESTSDQVEARLAPGFSPRQVLDLMERLNKAVAREKEPEEVDIALAVEREPVVELTVPVDSLRSGDRRMERDMHDALKADRHPSITFKLTGVKRAAWRYDEQGDIRFDLVVAGDLSLAGVERHRTIPVRIEPRGDRRFRVLGREAFEMSDFDIEPPTAFFGLIRAHERVEVTFDLIVKLKPEEP